MRANAILRAALLSSAALCLTLSASALVSAQDVGADVAGGAGIFRAKNPETKKGATKPGAKPTGKSSASNRAKASAVAERVEDLLDKGNAARDERKYSEAEEAYKEVLKLRARDARAAYGLGNVYSDQQRWDDAEAAYRNLDVPSRSIQRTQSVGIVSASHCKHEDSQTAKPSIHIDVQLN
jgi:tetratricopeptide (TPR) repeat protein